MAGGRWLPGLISHKGYVSASKQVNSAIHAMCMHVQGTKRISTSNARCRRPTSNLMFRPRGAWPAKSLATREEHASEKQRASSTGPRSSSPVAQIVGSGVLNHVNSVGKRAAGDLPFSLNVDTSTSWIFALALLSAAVPCGSYPERYRT